MVHGEEGNQGIFGAPETGHVGRADTSPGLARSLDESGIHPASMAVAGTTVGDYTVLSLLGQGGCARVYLATDNRLKRRVALKVLRGGHSVSPEQRRRFELEAATLAKLNHPGIVQVYEVGAFDKGNYIALEFLEGGSLDQALKGRPIPPGVAAVLVQKLALVIQTAHEAGVLHRDLKPANILLAKAVPPRDGQTLQVGDSLADLARVSDFGLARYVGDEGNTQLGEVVGTPSYMAPEQASGPKQKHGPATDVYSLGAILYEALTGRPPFQAATSLATVLLVIKQDPVPPRRLNPNVPRDLETICLKCLAKDPAKRYQTSRALADDLGAWKAGRPISARPASLPEIAWKWVLRNPWPSAAALASLLLLMTVLVSVAQIRGIRQADRNRALLDQILVADGMTLSPLLEQWRDAGLDSASLDQEIIRTKEDREITSRQKSTRWLNLALAQENSVALMEWLEQRVLVNLVGPEYLPLIGSKLDRADVDNRARIRLWADHALDSRYRIRLLGILANTSDSTSAFQLPDYRFIAREMLEKDTGLRRLWASVFTPVSKNLVDEFQGIFSGGLEKLGPAQRRAVVSYLIWFGKRDARGLLALGLGSDGTVLRELVDELQAEVKLDERQWSALWQLAEQTETGKDLDWPGVNEALAGQSGFKRKARANALLLLMIATGREDRGRILAALEEVLRQSADPEARHHLVIYAGQAQVPPDFFLDLFRNSSDTSVRRAALWALGGYPRTAFPIQFSWESWLDELAKTHRQTTDTGLHSAIDWLVGMVWNDAGGKGTEWLKKGTENQSVVVNSLGMKLAKVEGGREFRMGAPKKLNAPLDDIPIARPVRLASGYLLGTREVTVGQFRQFRPGFAAGSKDPDEPAVSVSLLDAARFCNWLSSREGIPPEQWAYPPQWEKTEDWPTLMEQLRIHRDRLGREKAKGYRLPGEAEWEFACRAGSGEPRSFGMDGTLLEKFAYMAVHETSPQKVGALLPNDFGFFDMLGNALEWTDDQSEPGLMESGRVGLGRGTVDPAGARWVMRGAGFDFQPLFFRSDYRYREFPAEKWFSYGFRVAKSVP